MEHEIDIAKHGFHDKFLSSISRLETLIKLLNEKNICKAVILKAENVNSKVAVPENNSVIRHKNCPILLENGNLCPDCPTSKSTIFKKKRIDAGLKQLRTDQLKKSHQQQIQQIRKKKKELQKAVKRKTDRLRYVNKELYECKKEMKEIN